MYRFGFFCSKSDNSLSTNRTINLNNLNYENVEKKVKQNAKELIELLEYSKTNNYPIFRLGNSFVPFISHKLFDMAWLDKLAPIFDETKERLKDFDTRITIHPGQYTVLNSPKENVIENSLRELEMFFWLFDRLGIDDNGTVLIHGRGAYGDKNSALEKLVETIEKEDWLKQRLALENDERVYTAKEILEVCQTTKIPMVFDIYHHSLNLSEFEPKDILKTWQKKRPKVHLSSKGDGKFGNHADFIEAKDFFELEKMFEEESKSIDIMVEAKKKELAIEKLRDEIK
ncbi:UV DNA damage repair endonuclease UvsE [Halarcobacter bivalviorum]|nr:UV DNA damage repair endonuclease UvsE [Halarcobacter bivalviorum]AXH12111.1 UV damage endonuclease UvsE [Halarcobacter bivalviorum]